MPAPWSYDMLSGKGTMSCHGAATLSAYAPWPDPNTRSPGLKGHPGGIGELAETRPANSAPNVNGNGGWFWYFPCACRIYMHIRMLWRWREEGEKRTYVEEVQPSTVDVHKHLALSWFWLRRIVDNRDLRGMCVRFDDCGPHCLCW